MPTSNGELVGALRELPDKARRALALAAPAAELARRYVNAHGFMFVGRGLTYPVALEGALKLKEVSYVHAEGYAAGELKHGPIALLDAEVPLVAIATRSPLQSKLVSNIMEGRARDARVLMVATEGDEAMREYADDVLWVPDTIEALSPVLAIIPLAAVRLPDGRVAGHRHRPAPQPGQVGDGRVSVRAVRGSVG